MDQNLYSISPRRMQPDDKGAEQQPIRVLIMDGDEGVREVCREVMHSLGYRALLAPSSAAALELVEKHPVDIVIADVGNGSEFVHVLKSKNPRLEVAIAASSAAVPKAVQALRRGASQYIVKPYTSEELRQLVRRLVQTLQLKDENRYLRERLQSRDRFGRLIGQSQPMQQVFKMIQKVSLSRSPVLILGESGTGKELVALSIHEFGPCRERPFVPVDCGSLSPTLIESELFGHVRGAFTGAVQSKEGLLETARSGTLFFDEIAELPVELQSRLLRAVQEKEFRPVGSTQRIGFEGRIIAATNRDLRQAVEQGTFRKDLYFRLNVVSITLPPLRERKTDIPLLAQEILSRLSGSESGRRVKSSWALSSEALDRLMLYDWPGNVRELENSLERAVTVGSGPLIRSIDLPSNLQTPTRLKLPGVAQTIIPLEDMERQAIERALESTGGDKMMAARLLGIGKTTLYRKLSKYQKS